MRFLVWNIGKVRTVVIFSMKNLPGDTHHTTKNTKVKSLRHNNWAVPEQLLHFKEWCRFKQKELTLWILAV